MDPVYNCMQSYPYLNNQMPYWPHNYPGTQPFQAQMYMNPPRPPVNQECWPWANYGYAGPVSCHGCVNHNYLPTHCGFRPPYSHVPPVHCPGNSHIPVQYMPPHYTMQQPQYEYDKNIPRNHHCCGCPNHQCQLKEQKNIKIEEEPDVERRKNDSLVPFQLKNYPYPIVYLPHDFGNNKEHEKLNKSGHDGKDRFLEAKPDENLKDSEQQRNLDRNRQQQDDGEGRFPFPIIWMPYETEEKDKKSHKVNNGNQEQSLVPAKGSHAEQNDNVNGQHNGGHASSKLRDIPVKEVKQHEVKESSGNKEKEKNVSVKDGNENAEKKLAKDGSKSSSPKSSKLPPVCLRVDPLPRRKTSNGSSRSPSPPGDKRKLDNLPSNEAVRKIVTSDNVASCNEKITENMIKEDDGTTKAIEISGEKICQGESKDVNVGPPADLPVSAREEVSTNHTKDKPQEENISLECRKNGELFENVNKDDTKSSKIRLTDDEAAVVIQSAYRGFDVRRWAPLKKLKQIAKVREQIGDVKNRVQALEMSSDIQYRSKERNVIAELIMSLLLKLDTIQGLHPSVREIRKSVVRELVSLQEKLDSLLNEKSEAAAVQESTMRHDEEASKEQQDITMSKDSNEARSELPESCQHDLDGESNNEILENSEKTGNGEQMGMKLETESAKEEEQIEKVDKDDELSNMKEMEDHEDRNVGQSSEISNLQKNSSLEMTDFSPTESLELLKGVCDDSYISQGINGAQFEEGMSKADHQPELKIDPTDDENKEHVKWDEAINVEMVDKEMTTEDEMDNRTEDIISGPTDECSAHAQTPQNVVSDVFEPCEKEIPIEKAIEGKDANGDLPLHDDLEVINPDNSSNSVEKEISHSQLPSKAHLEQEKIPVDDFAVTHEPTSIVAVKVDEEESKDSIIAEQRDIQVVAAIDDHDEVLGKEEPEQKEACQVANESIIDTPLNIDEPTHEYDLENLLPKESVETGNLETSTGNEDSIIAQQRHHIVAAIDDHDEVLVEEKPEQKRACQVTNESIIDTPLNTNEPRHETNLENLLPKESVETGNLITSTGDEKDSAFARDELIEANGKLIEENEKLRDMMEKLIKSGQEQLASISTLSGKVKDLERKLYRRKRMKVKPYREPRSRLVERYDY